MKRKTPFKRNLSTILVFPLLLFFMSCEEEDAFLDSESSTQPKDCLVDGCNLCTIRPRSLDLLQVRFIRQCRTATTYTWMEILSTSRPRAACGL